MNNRRNILPRRSKTLVRQARRSLSRLAPGFSIEHFSEQLYSSLQKAFEELTSNGWDANASRVDVRISPDLKTNASATMAALDNGVSIDEEGLRQLRHIAFSQNGRMVKKLERVEIP